MAKRQRLIAEPRKYTVPEDLSEERYAQVLFGMCEFFTQFRVTKEPAAVARQELQYCMDGVTKAGLPWFSMASSSLAARVRSMCRFDIDTMQPIAKASEVNRKKKDREKERQRAKAQHDQAIPEELRKGHRKTAKYGDQLGVLLSSAEERMWKEYRRGVVKEYPEVNTITSAPMLDKLCDLKVMQERHRLGFLSGKPADPVDERYVVEQMTSLMTALGIHANQLAKKVTNKLDTTIAAASARLDAMADDWRRLRVRWFAEEMLQAYSMFMQPSADGLSYQLDEVGLFGLTKSRVVCCPKCSTKNFAGFAIDEIEAWLVKEGYLTKIGTGAQVFEPRRTMQALDDEQAAALDQIDANTRAIADIVVDHDAPSAPSDVLDG